MSQALFVLTEALDIVSKIGEPQVHVLSSIYRLMAQANLQRDNIDIAKLMADDAYRLVEAVGNSEQTALSQAILAQNTQNIAPNLLRILISEVCIICFGICHLPE